MADGTDSLANFRLREKLGSGSYGVVYRAEQRATREICVIKQIQIDQLERDEAEQALNEVRILAMLDSPYITKYLSSFIDKGKLCIVMEYASNGTLYGKLKEVKRSGSTMSEVDIWLIFIQTCLGLLHIHSKSILHRDLKTENIFLGENDVVKIGDLGVARLMDSRLAFANTFVGTPYYLSPELCRNRPYNDKSDVWALGCILYEMCCLQPPFTAQNQGALMFKIVRGKYTPPPRTFSRDMRDVVRLLLVRDHHRRPSIAQILLNPIVTAKAVSLKDSLAVSIPERSHSRSEYSRSSSSSSGSSSDSSGGHQEPREDFWLTTLYSQGLTRDDVQEQATLLSTGRPSRRGRNTTRRSQGGDEDVVSDLLHQQAELNKQHATARQKCLRLLENDSNLLEELYEVCQRLADYDEEEHVNAEQRKQREREHAEIIDNLVLKKISLEQMPAIDLIYQMLSIDAELARTTVLLEEVLQ